MTDEMTRALQHQVRKDETETTDQQIERLANWIDGLDAAVQMHDNLLIELHNRIERLEGKISLDKLEGLVSGEPVYEHKAYGYWVDDKGIGHIGVIPKGDPSGCICPTDSLTECPVCRESYEITKHQSKL